MRGMICLASFICLCVGGARAAEERVLRANFANDGGVGSTWSFPDEALHCVNNAACRKVIDTIRAPRGFYACRASLKRWPWLRGEGQAHVILNVARGRGGFDYYADPYDAQGPMRLEALLTLRPKGASPSGCMKAGPVFDCQRYGCLPAQPGGTEW